MLRIRRDLDGAIRFGLSAASAVLVLTAVPPAMGQTGGTKAPAYAKLDLVPGVKGIAPGRTFDLALHFRLDDGWHIYWENGGDAGFPPTVKWQLPAGFEAGDLQFPAPQRHVNEAGIVSNIHEGDPALVVAIKVPNAVADKNVTVGADIKYLICKEICIRGESEVSVELPVLGAGSPVEAANAELFDRARRARPIRQSKYLSISASLSAPDLSPGGRLELLVTVEPAEGYRIASREPLSNQLSALDLFVGRTDDIYFEQAQYPRGSVGTHPKLGKVNEYTGRTTIRVKGELEAEETLPAPPRVGGVLRFQACDASGECFPAEALAFTTSVGQNVGEGPSDAATPAGTTSDMRSSTNAGSGKLEDFLAGLGLPGLILGCFLYGLFINATPCVLPLLSIKVLGFVQQAHESRKRTTMLGLAFGAGVVGFFVLLGILAAQGTNVLQYPAAVIALGAVVMALALSMLGVYTLQVPTAATRLEASIQKEGLLSSFGKGALAPVLGFACTGPLLAGAFGWATQQPPRIAVLAFVVAGLGMASPYMLLGANPKWLSFLPRPGNWMITFERIMGFLLLGMVVWLLDPLVVQLGPEGLELTLVFLVAVAMACWILGKVDATMEIARRWRYRGGAAALVACSGLAIYVPQYTGQTYKVEWSEWSPGAAEEAARRGRPVLVDFTAAYCTECKANKKLAFNTRDVVEKIKKLDILTLQGDFTDGDERVFAMLQQFGRAGVPLNLIYPAHRPDDPILLPVNLNEHFLVEQLEQAAEPRTESLAVLEP